MTAPKAMIAVLALGVTLGGCATRVSVENAQASANAADRRAMNAQSRADDAYGVGQEALGVGHDAKSAALIAEQKADQANADLSAVKRRITAMEWQGKPQKKSRKARTTQARTNS
jgi:hypothetical protein